MKPRNEWPSLNISELEKEIEIREQLLNQMVGSLYSGIVLEERYELLTLISNIKAAERKAKKDMGGGR